MQKMLSGRAPLDSHVGGVQDVQSWLPGFHVFRFSLCLTCRMCKNEFQFDLGFCPRINTSMGKKKSGKGRRLAQPPAQVRDAAFREVHLFCFAFLLLFCCVFSCLLLFLFFTSQYFNFFAVSHTKYPNLKVPNSDRNLPFRLTA